jgi:DNA polymerase-3 subunit beta
MKLTLNLDALKNAVNVVKGATESGATNFSLLEGIMIEVTGEGKVYLRGSDRTAGVVCEVPAEVDADGTALGSSDSNFVMPKNFPAVVGRLKGDQVEINYDHEKSKAQLRCGQNRFAFNTAVATNYPIFPEPSGGWTYEIDQKTFKEALKRTSIAMDKSSNGRSIFQGVLFNVAGDMSLAATNSYVLTREIIMRGVDWMEQGDVVIPAATVKLLLGLLGDTNERQIRIRIEDTTMFFEIGGDYPIRLHSSKIHGQFPAVSNVIPTSTSFNVVVDRKDLIDGLQLVQPLAETFTLRIDVDKENNLLYLTGQQSSQGNGVVKVPIENCVGDAVSVCADGKFIMDCLKSLSVDKVRLGFTRQDAPCTIKILDSNDYVYVYMPVRAPIEQPEELRPLTETAVESDVVDYDSESAGEEDVA